MDVDARSGSPARTAGTDIHLMLILMLKMVLLELNFVLVRPPHFFFFRPLFRDMASLLVLSTPLICFVAGLESSASLRARGIFGDT